MGQLEVMTDKPLFEYAVHMNEPSDTAPDRYTCDECGDTDSPCKHAQIHYGTKEYERGRLAERTDTLAWLRKQDGMWTIPDNTECQHGQWSWEGCEQCAIPAVAAAIERGEHIKDTT